MNTAQIRHQHILNRHRQQDATTKHTHIMNTLPTFATNNSQSASSTRCYNSAHTYNDTLPTFATNTFSIGIVNKMLQHNTFATNTHNDTHWTLHIRDQHILNRHRQQDATTQHKHIMTTLPTLATNTFSIGIVNKMLQHNTTHTLWTHCPQSPPTHSRSASSTRCYNTTHTHNEHTATTQHIP